MQMVYSLNNHMKFDEEYRKLMLEFSEGAIRNIVKKFHNDATEREIRREIDDFEKYKKSLQKKDPFQYKTWIEFTEAIHAAKGKAEFKKGTPTQDVVANQDDIIADDENVTIYRGDSQDKCVLYGKGYTFCISRKAGGNMFSNYRLGKESTFYFIYFKKKPKSVTDHIMVLDHTKNGWEWTFADNHTQEVRGGWNEIFGRYPELGIYKDLLVNKKLDGDEKKFIQGLKDFRENPTLEQFELFSYGEKIKVLKSTQFIKDDVWESLDFFLRNEYLNVSPNLNNKQADSLNLKEIKLYKKVRNLNFKQLNDNNAFLPNIHDDIENVLNGKNATIPYVYAKFALHWKNVPDEIYKNISKDLQISLKTAKDLRENTPNIIINKIAQYGDSSHSYATFLNWKNVPKNIIRGIEISPLYHTIPNNVTIQESLHFDKYYQNIMLSFFK